MIFVFHFDILIAFFIIIFRKMWILVTDHARVFKPIKMVLTKSVFVWGLDLGFRGFQFWYVMYKLYRHGCM